MIFSKLNIDSSVTWGKSINLNQVYVKEEPFILKRDLSDILLEVTKDFSFLNWATFDSTISVEECHC